MSAKEKMSSGSKTGAASENQVAEEIRYRLCRAIYPNGFFNRDASLRLTLENERLKELLGGTA